MSTVAHTVLAADLLAVFGARLTSAMREAGISNKDLGHSVARSLGTDPKSTVRRIQRYAAGESMPASARVWIALCDPLGVSPASLLR